MPIKFLKGRSISKMLNVDGITCEPCVETIKEAVEILDEVLRVDVSLEIKQVVVEFDEKMRNQKIYKDKIEKVGVKVRM